MLRHHIKNPQCNKYYDNRMLPHWNDIKVKDGEKCV